jgi:hypothetical protein
MVADSVVDIRGKLDLSRNDPQIICESVSTEFVAVTSETAVPTRSYSAYEEAEPLNGNGYYSTSVEPPSLDELPLDGVDDLPPPFIPENHEQAEPPRTLRVSFHRNGDDEHDRRRLKRLIGIITQEHGQDHFEIVIMTDGVPTHMMEFPNQTTRYSDKLLDEVRKLKGVEVDPATGVS